MDTINEFLEQTKSAVQTLFEGVNNYLKILYEVEAISFSCDCGDVEEYKEKYKIWAEKNKEKIQNKINIQDRYINEIFAQSILCGSIIQIASMAIKKYSRNKLVPEILQELPKINSAKKYCIGREVRGIPIGLLIYTARNQYNHLDENYLREPSKSILKKAATLKPLKGGTDIYIDPAFDINNPNLINYASNITALIGWRSYQQYTIDMREMLES